ncbi:MAG: hypothetical protein JRJ42_02780 [Deltaproteobacteria bacterium]|nr:hypothetical protein [Deltaproteobacteria bacterium]MBW2018924.1 hypothetical protein [Deltaproteobacteria bacterium]MBW2073139.1 hypothetical protein [Deltaproteobacteria bacterium]
MSAKDVYVKSLQLDSSQKNVEMILRELEKLSEVFEHKQKEEIQHIRGERLFNDGYV